MSSKIMKKVADQEILRRTVLPVFEDRIAKACNPDSIIRMADIYAETQGIQLYQMFEEVNFTEATRKEEDLELKQEELTDLYYAERRKFDAEFIKKHMTDLDGGIFAQWLASDAAIEAVRDPDLKENRKLMEALGADISIKGIKPIY